RKVGLNDSCSGSITNSGLIEIQSGRLVVGGHFLQIAGLTVLNGSAITNASPFELQAGTLIGNGVIGTGIAGPGLTNNGAISPGNPFGLLIIAGTFTQTTNGSLNIEIGGFSPVTSYDHIRVGGAN